MSQLQDETAWLLANPHFRERPATVEEFLGPRYLNIRSGMRESLIVVLNNVMGETVGTVKPTAVSRALFTGAIGIGKTTLASIILPYLVHWCLCLKDPCDYFDLLPGSRIAFMLMSTSERQARNVLFGDIKARIKHSPWFKNTPIDPKLKNTINFQGTDLWILPGDSRETTFEGYNILGGILDEADSHTVTDEKDYAEVGYDTIRLRMTSRFGHKGFIMIIGQRKSDAGFAERMYQEFLNDDDAYAISLTIWESMGNEFYADDEGNVNWFFYDPDSKNIVDAEYAHVAGQDHLIQVPETYRIDFLRDPPKALKDLAGIPPSSEDPFIGLRDRILSARFRGQEANFVDVDPTQPTYPVDLGGILHPEFYATDSIPRVAHMDIAYSAKGDGLGIAMGHIARMVEVDGELKPYIVIDLLYRMKAKPGDEVRLADARNVLYVLRNERKFNITEITLDGFQSKDSEQQFKRRRFRSRLLSVDKERGPYFDLREAIYDERIEWPTLRAVLDLDGNPVDILVRELSQLSDDGRKIDHPPLGSKDVADCVAGVTWNLMTPNRHRPSKRAAAGARGVGRSTSADPRSMLRRHEESLTRLTERYSHGH